MTTLGFLTGSRRCTAEVDTAFEDGRRWNDRERSSSSGCSQSNSPNTCSLRRSSCFLCLVDSDCCFEGHTTAKCPCSPQTKQAAKASPDDAGWGQALRRCSVEPHRKQQTDKAVVFAPVAESDEDGHASSRWPGCLHRKHTSAGAAFVGRRCLWCCLVRWIGLTLNAPAVLESRAVRLYRAARVIKNKSGDEEEAEEGPSRSFTDFHLFIKKRLWESSLTLSFSPHSWETLDSCLDYIGATLWRTRTF